MKYKKNEDLPVIQFENNEKIKGKTVMRIFVVIVFLFLFFIFKSVFAYGDISGVSIESPVYQGQDSSVAVTYTDYEMGTELSTRIIVASYVGFCNSLVTNPTTVNEEVDTTSIAPSTYTVYFRTYETTDCSGFWYDSFGLGNLVVEEVPIPDITTKQFTGLLFSSIFMSSLIILVVGGLIMLTKEAR